MEAVMQEYIEQMVNFIMKKCLWQFHSRTWDRERQNREILRKTMQILCREPVEHETPADRCYWVDAVYLADNFQRRFPWLAAMDREEIKLLMRRLKERIDYLTIKGSLNLELTDPLY
jgi:nitrogenase delta subunit